MFCTVSGCLDSAEVPFTITPYLVLCCLLSHSSHMTHGGDIALSYSSVVYLIHAMQVMKDVRRSPSPLSLSLNFLAFGLKHS